MSFRDSLQRAFRLAFFIHGERQLAVQIAVEAVARTEVAASAQKKRRYYNPIGRSSPSNPGASAPHRTKVTMEGAQLLQRLVYVVSDTYEQHQEMTSRGELSEEDMIIRYVKHLVRLTVKRNSFYVSLGIGRLLHDYGTADAMDLYSLVVGDPERSRDDYYYRSRKRQLMKELEERFGEMLEVVRGARGERRFRTRGDDAGRSLVQRCLQIFTPWDTRCVVPDDFDPQVQELEPLVFEGKDPDGEHPVELRRMHSLLHPPCFGALAASLGLEPSEQRLQIPCFAGAFSGMSGGGREQSKDLDGIELGNLEGILREQAKSRRRHQAAILSIAVDGLEKARFDVNHSPAVRLQLQDGDELVEVFAHPEGEEPVLLAIELLGDLEALDGERRRVFRAQAGGRYEVSFVLTAGAVSLDHRRGSLWMEVVYRELGVWRIFQAKAQDVWRRLVPQLVFPRPVGGLVAAGLLALVLGGTELWNRSFSDLSDGALASGQQGQSRSVPPGASEDARTRGTLPIETFGEDQLEVWIDSARELENISLLSPLLEELQDLESLVLVEDPEEADLALKWLVEEPGAMGLVDTEGRILWRWRAENVDGFGPGLRAALKSYRHSP